MRMMKQLAEAIMSEKKYTKDHEWLAINGDVVTVGITQYAEDNLGDVVFVELPELGRNISVGEEIVVIESVKAAADIKAPVTGEIIEVNAALVDTPELVNQSPLEDAWFFKVKATAFTEELLDEAAYNAFIESEA